jgi:hypothetical protein
MKGAYGPAHHLISTSWLGGASTLLQVKEMNEEIKYLKHGVHLDKCQVTTKLW